MHSELRLATKTAIVEILKTYASVECKYGDRYIVWKRDATGSWSGKYEERLLPPWTLDTFNWSGAAKAVIEALALHHPDHVGMVGTPRGWSAFNGEALVRSVMEELWQRYGSCNVPDASIELLVDDLAKGIGSSEIPTSAFATLANLELPEDCDRLELPKGMVIRSLTDDEATISYGGSLHSSERRGPDFSFSNWLCVAGEFREPKLLNPVGFPATDPSVEFEQNLYRLILAFWTFQSGRVGIGAIHYRPAIFCPFGMAVVRSGMGTNYVGSYIIRDEDIAALHEHCRLILGGLHSTLELACSRLADAENRAGAREVVLDSVIGMETILLSATGKEEYRGELRYRFSLNYAALFEQPEERFDAFYSARSLYDLRSLIAHGGGSDEKVRLGKEQVTLSHAADRAKDVLRGLIKRFLPDGKSPRYLKPQFWERRYFGLPMN